MISEITEKESRELLRELTTGRLGGCDDKEPYIVPVNYYFDGETIYVHSLPGRKIEIMRVNPHVCLQVDKIDDAYNWRSVIAYGSIDEVNESTERDRMATAMFFGLPHLPPVESKISDITSKTRIFRLCIERIIGVCERWL